MVVAKFFGELFGFVSEEDSNIHEMSKVSIERYAINQYGIRGSLYDAYKDRIKGKLVSTDRPQPYGLPNEIKCVLSEGRRADTQNLLEFVDLDYQLRINILSKITEAGGIASVTHYSRVIDSHTRFLCIHHASHSEFWFHWLLQFLLKFLSNPIIQPIV